MAIALDRATSAIAERTDPTRQHLTDEGRRRARITTARASSPRSSRSRWCATRSASLSVYPDEFETASYVYTATIQDSC